MASIVTTSYLRPTAMITAIPTLLAVRTWTAHDIAFNTSWFTRLSWFT